MTMLTKIGNSQGIRIPKPIIKQANLENKEIEFEVTKDGLLLKPIKNKARKNNFPLSLFLLPLLKPIKNKARKNWEEKYQKHFII